jgi:hypothetical protein
MCIYLLRASSVVLVCIRDLTSLLVHGDVAFAFRPPVLRAASQFELQAFLSRAFFIIDQSKRLFGYLSIMKWEKKLPVSFAGGEIFPLKSVTIGPIMSPKDSAWAGHDVITFQLYISGYDPQVFASSVPPKKILRIVCCEIMPILS